MSKEEITYKIPNNQIHISEKKDEDCLIWISPKALYMANTIDKLQQENQKYKEVIDKAIEYINHFSKESEVKIYGLPKCKVFIGDIEQLLEILKEVSE